MIVTFSSRHYADVVLFGPVASTLLRAMGLPENPPGALTGEHVQTAADRLRVYLASLPEDTGDEAADDDEADDGDDDDKPETVSLQTRALPLLDLLDTAAREGDEVTWRA